MGSRGTSRCTAGPSIVPILPQSNKGCPLSASPGPLAVLAVKISPADVGRRVTIRHRLPDTSTLSDVVGILLTWTPYHLTLRRRDGSVRIVAVLDLVAAKVVSPELSAYAVQAIAEASWPALEQEPLGDWNLRWAHGVTNRANSTRVGGDPGLPLVQALSYVQSWYAARGARAVLQLPDPWTADAQLDALGWPAYKRTIVMTCESQQLAEHPAAVGFLISMRTDPTDDWWSLVPLAAADLPVLAQILTRPTERAFATARDPDGTLLAIGRAAINSAGSQRWNGVANLNTTEAARGRGIGAALLAGLGRWALDRNATTTYLQVEADNLGARRLYERLGFSQHHAYCYRSPTG